MWLQQKGLWVMHQGKQATLCKLSLAIEKRATRGHHDVCCPACLHVLCEYSKTPYAHNALPSHEQMASDADARIVR